MVFARPLLRSPWAQPIHIDGVDWVEPEAGKVLDEGEPVVGEVVEEERVIGSGIDLDDGLIDRWQLIVRVRLL